ncbi:Zn-dependent hydrolase [Entomomonas moraniae]|uniref:Zn-dependent hydrolase n=1 Tax=Entomomonas moraniae TaxID=2213226 RepID=A0A3Q9JMT2_9GAMM|nr:Zn-dependent hydrolase [Entomomonas moraniae]AZS49887.1 Zn-dependent hydrolase [Entomomonas moraniae]
MTQSLRVNKQRLMGFLNTLGTFGALEGGGVCRLALSAADKQARDWVVSQMQALGLTIRIDQIGNVIGIYKGQEDVPPVMMGSHIDTVATGGLYDGCFGVMAGLEVISTLKDSGITPKRPVAVAFFTDEEGARFAPDMFGSLVFQGGLSLEEALAIKDVDGFTVGEELDKIGYKGNAPVGCFEVDTFLEAHIEQGPVLDKEGIKIGVVESVQGISWTEFTIEGVSNHAGTTPMSMRHDAGLVAAKINVFAREVAHKIGGSQVATVGYISCKPNLINVVPNHVVMTVDLRNTDNDVLKQAETLLFDYAENTAKEEGVKISRRKLARFDPVYFHKEIVDLVEQEAEAAGLNSKRMPSGAGHDAQILKEMCPTAMIFVPCKDGLSHNVKEFTEPDDLEAGANILLSVILKRANRP